MHESGLLLSFRIRKEARCVACFKAFPGDCWMLYEKRRLFVRAGAARLGRNYPCLELLFNTK